MLKCGAQPEEGRLFTSANQTQGRIVCLEAVSLTRLFDNKVLEYILIQAVMTPGLR